MDKLIKKGDLRLINNEQMLVKTIYNSLCAIGFLHEANVMHRDVKCSNLLIDKHCNVKISDFGLARTIPQPYPGNKTLNTMLLREEYFQKCQNDEIIQDESFEDYVSKELTKSLTFRKTLKRNISVNVGTRWYRAPEVSLVERQYD